MQKDIWSFFEMLFIIAKIGDKNVYQWYMHIIGYYKVIKRNGKRNYIQPWSDLHDTGLGKKKKKRQEGENVCRMLLFV